MDQRIVDALADADDMLLDDIVLDVYENMASNINNPFHP